MKYAIDQSDWNTNVKCEILNENGFDGSYNNNYNKDNTQKKEKLICHFNEVLFGSSVDAVRLYIPKECIKINNLNVFSGNIEMSVSFNTKCLFSLFIRQNNNLIQLCDDIFKPIRLQFSAKSYSIWCGFVLPIMCERERIYKFSIPKRFIFQIE